MTAASLHCSQTVTALQACGQKGMFINASSSASTADIHTHTHTTRAVVQSTCRAADTRDAAHQLPATHLQGSVVAGLVLSKQSP